MHAATHLLTVSPKVAVLGIAFAVLGANVALGFRGGARLVIAGLGTGALPIQFTKAVFIESICATEGGSPALDVIVVRRSIVGLYRKDT